MAGTRVQNFSKRINKIKKVNQIAKLWKHSQTFVVLVNHCEAVPLQMLDQIDDRPNRGELVWVHVDGDFLSRKDEIVAQQNVWHLVLVGDRLHQRGRPRL